MALGAAGWQLRPQSNVANVLRGGVLDKMKHARWLTTVTVFIVAAWPHQTNAALVGGAGEVKDSRYARRLLLRPLETVATGAPQAQTPPPMPAQVPLPPMPPIGKEFLPTLAPTADTERHGGRVSLLQQAEHVVGDVLEPEKFTIEVFRIKEDPLVVSAPPGADEAATAAIRQLRMMLTTIIFLSSCCCAGVITFVAYQYKTHKAEKVSSKYGGHEDFKDFKTGLFDCWNDLPLCCFIFQCPWIRWAENISMVSNAQAEPGKVAILGFWIAFATFLVLTMLSHVGGVLIWVITACVLAFFRQKVRKAFSMKNNTGSCMQDFLLYLCCCYCLIAQDARHVDEAKRQSHPAIVEGDA